MANPEHLALLEQGVEAWNRWWEHRKFDGMHPDLSGAFLDNVDLSYADLTRANLSRAHLHGASLYMAKLSRADLRNAKLLGADLGGAQLYMADLSAADLALADLWGADLRVDLDGARMAGTKLVEVNLAGTKGLETVRHEGPSPISIDTIYRSAGNIPEIFLRGAGVPEPFIQNMRALVGAMSPIEFYSCFISYSHADKAFARRLHDAL
jgi:hypothetical protein